MRVMVTGANGFIGKYIVKELLENGYEVIGLVRSSKPEASTEKLHYICGSLERLDELEKNSELRDIDSCIHLAWEGIPDYSFEQSEKNLQYGLNILKLCKSKNIGQLLVTGSCWEYENPIGEIEEGWKVNSKTAFGAAKNSLRMLSSAFCLENKIHFNWLRLFYVIGAGQRDHSLIPYLIREIGNNCKPALKSPYDQNDFIDVEDVAKAILAVMKKKPTEEIFNVGSGNAVSVLEIAQKIEEKMSKNINLDFGKPKTVNSFYASVQNMQKVVGWQTESNIDATVIKMVKYYTTS